MLWWRKEVDLEHLVVDKLSYLEFEKTGILDIKRIWKKVSAFDVDYDDAYVLQDELPYKWDDPLYMKMVHRFRNCNKRIAQFWHQIDVGNQCILIRATLIPATTRVGGILRDYNELCSNVEFFAWISNMLGAYEIKQNLDMWKTTPIQWYFELDETTQRELVHRFNSGEIATHNSFLTDYASKE
jgi:hypothetical protein